MTKWLVVAAVIGGCLVAYFLFLKPKAEKKRFRDLSNQGDPTNITVPRFVHNKCTGKWAVIDVGVDPLNMSAGKRVLYLGDMGIYFRGNLHDTLICAELGDEIAFPDSISAVNCYRRVKAKEKENEDKASREKATKDSIFKCQHTYQ